MMNTGTPGGSDDAADGDRGISSTLDATLDLLANRRRRYVLYCLRERRDALSVADLAEQLLAWERDDPPDDVDEQVVADLHHCHLPRLEEAGAVTYDEESGRVSLAASAEEPLTEYLGLAACEEEFDLTICEEIAD